MFKENRKVIIVFPDNWLSYSPTTINLSKLLSAHFPVTIISTGKDVYLSDTFEGNRDVTVNFIDDRRGLKDILVKKADKMLISIFSFFLRLKFLNKGWVRELLIGYNIANAVNFLKFRRRLKKIFKPGDILIGIDNVGIMTVSRFQKNSHALSLEIGRNVFYYFIKWKRIKSIIIQTEERRKYYLPSKYSDIKTYFVQNAPPVDSHGFTGVKTNNHRIIYMGNLAVEYNALDKIADSLQYLPKEYSIVFKGPANSRTEAYFQQNYIDLCKSSRVVFDSKYIPNDMLPDYLSSFSFGVSLYDIDILPYENFNVISCPSGKLFNYYNSGIPVIGSNIIGLRSVSDFRAGILIRELNGKAIANAISDISDHYIEYAENSRKAALFFDFTKNANNFVVSELPV